MVCPWRLSSKTFVEFDSTPVAWMRGSCHLVVKRCLQLGKNGYWFYDGRERQKRLQRQLLHSVFIQFCVVNRGQGGGALNQVAPADIPLGLLLCSAAWRHSESATKKPDKTFLAWGVPQAPWTWDRIAKVQTQGQNIFGLSPDFALSCQSIALLFSPSRAPASEAGLPRYKARGVSAAGPQWSSRWPAWPTTGTATTYAPTNIPKRVLRGTSAQRRRLVEVQDWARFSAGSLVEERELQSVPWLAPEREPAFKPRVEQRW